MSALVFVYGAYMAEVYRAGIEAVPRGQMEAARSLGMSHFQAMRHIIVPQAVTKIPAPMLNELISLLKDTTLVSVIALRRVGPGQPRNPRRTAEQLGADPHRRLLPGDHACRCARLVDYLIKRNAGQNHPRLPHRGRVMPEPMLQLKGIHKRFGQLEVLKGVDLEVAKGEVICILGPSGSGKSTLLRCVNLLAPPEEGEIFLEGQDICKGPGSGTGEQSWNLDFVRQRVGMVFQQFNLFPHKTALQNVTLAPQQVLGKSK